MAWKPLVAWNRTIAGTFRYATGNPFTVVDSGTGLFGFNHRFALWRTLWPVRRATTNAVATAQTGFTHGFLPGLPGVALPANAADWFDLKLLPPVESVEKYFHYTVYGGTASTNGITWKMFEPTPPGLK